MVFDFGKFDCALFVLYVYRQISANTPKTYCNEKKKRSFTRIGYYCHRTAYHKPSRATRYINQSSLFIESTQFPHYSRNSLCHRASHAYTTTKTIE